MKNIDTRHHKGKANLNFLISKRNSLNNLNTYEEYKRKPEEKKNLKNHES